MNMNKVIARAWADPAYKAKLLSDPHSALSAAGVDVPRNIKLKVVESTADTKYIVLPAAPSGAGELTDEELGKVSAGACALVESCLI